MNLVKIFKYIIGINVLIVFLFFVLVLIVNFSQKKSEEKYVVSDKNSYQQTVEDKQQNESTIKPERENILNEKINDCNLIIQSGLDIGSCELYSILKNSIVKNDIGLCNISKNLVTVESCKENFSFYKNQEIINHPICVFFINENNENLCQ